MIYREANTDDIAGLHHVRMSVRENILNNPALVKESDYVDFLTTKGKGWLCEEDNGVLGFAIIDFTRNNIWALFVHPNQEKKGIGRRLQHLMLSWHFSNSRENLWLTTAPRTRAESFYLASGWKGCGRTSQGETRFEMDYNAWLTHQRP